MHLKLSDILKGFWLKLDQRTKFISTAFVVLFLFGDTLLPAIGHSLFLCFEVIELLLEHWLEFAFHLTSRQAQLLLFWSSMLPLCYVVWLLYCKAYLCGLHLRRTIRGKWLQQQEFRKTKRYKLALLFGSIGITLVLFS